MTEPCPLCDDRGMRLVERDGARFAVPCSCRVERRVAQQRLAAGIPARYEHSTLDDYEASFPGADPSLAAALIAARRFVEQYPIETDGRGLLFTGPNGTGKTTLAVSLLRALMTERGAQGLFVTYGELLKQVQNSYNNAVAETEADVLRPVMDAEVLVIDELGAVKPTEWVRDTVAHILNTRYNERRTTILTTNFANERELVTEPAGMSKDARAAWLAMYQDTLGDRIGERMLSRLQEMCLVVELHGADFRRSVKRARLG